MILKIIVEDKAKEDLKKMDGQLKDFFSKHMEKIALMPPRRHLQQGLPFFVENVTKQARLAYRIESGNLYIVRCFALHKDYEKWYKSFT